MISDAILKAKAFVWNCTFGSYYRVRNYLKLRFFPEKIIEEQWKREMGYPLDWNHPRDLNEKIQWLLVNSDTREWSKLADKIAVRDYIRKKGLGDLLIPLYGVWKKAEDIDFESLPNVFVLKCNHDSGSSMVIDKAKKPDWNKIRNIYNAKLKVDYGASGEVHYSRIRPRILAEKRLSSDPVQMNNPPIDYKVWCFNGKAYYIWTCYGRSLNAVYTNVFDRSWNLHLEYSKMAGHYKVGDGRIPRPITLVQMLDAAEKLSEGFPEVRIDFYEVGGKLYFGEMTFTSMCGMMKYFTPAFLNELGGLVQLKGVR